MFENNRIAIPVVIAASVAAALLAMRLPAARSTMETFTVDNLIANTSIKDNGLTASTLVATDGSKVLQSYAGSGCGSGSAVRAVSSDGSLTCTAAGGVTNSAGNNIVTKSNGTDLVASSISDDGTSVTTSEPGFFGGFTNSKNLVMSGTIAPTAFSGTRVDNYNPTGLATTFVIAQDASADTILTGITAQTAGTQINLHNISATSTITLSNADENSSAANRFTLPGGINWRLPPGAAITLRYSSTNSTWRPASAVTQAYTASCIGPTFGVGDPPYNDWNPACMANSTTIQVWGGDNNGTTVTGFDAIDNGASTTIAVASNGASLPQATINVASTGGFTISDSTYLIYVTTGTGQQTVSCTGVTSTTFTGCTGGSGTMSTGGSVLGGMPLGTIRTICNTGANTDDGSIVLSIENTGSKANNRIWAHYNQAATFEDRLRIGSAACMTFLYSQPEGAGVPAVRRWIAQTNVVAAYHTIVQNFELFPHATPDPISGTLNNWNPAACGSGSPTPPLNGSCEAGGSLDISDYSYVLITTVSSAGATLTGMASAGLTGKNEGEIKLLYNAGPGPVYLVNSSGSSAVQNQFFLSAPASPAGNNGVIPVGSHRIFVTRGQGWNEVSSDWQGADNGAYTTLGGLSLADPGVTTSTSIGARGFVDLQPPGTATTDPVLYGVREIDARSVDTTSAAFTIFGASWQIQPTRSAGPNALNAIGDNVSVTAPSQTYGVKSSASGGSVQNTAGYFTASNTNAYAIETNTGNCYLGESNPASIWIKSQDSESLSTWTVATTLFVGGSTALFTTTRMEACAQFGAPTVSHGSLSADSGNCIGRITGIGSNTSTTLTFSSAFGTTSHCQVTAASAPGGGVGELVYVTPSASAPVFNCIDSTTGTAANCPDLEYYCMGH